MMNSKKIVSFLLSLCMLSKYKYVYIYITINYLFKIISIISSEHVIQEDKWRNYFM